MPMLGNHKAYAEILPEALKHNYRIMRDEIKRASPNTSTICVLKADAYGHGAKNCCRALLEEGCRFFAVSSIEEAIDLREVCLEYGADAEILILGYTLPSQAALLAKYNIITSLVDPSFAEELAREAAKISVRVKCHIKLDTGMNRIGFPAKCPSDIAESVEDITNIFRHSSLNICGMFTHFAKADDALDDPATRKFTDRQTENFKALDEALLSRGIDVGFRHVCNSAAAMGFPEYHFDACRLGITLYGTHSSRVVDKYALMPVMRLCTVVSHVHTLRVGESVSYGGIYTADRPTKIATIPIGYADGFIRAYSGAQVSVMTSDGTVKAKILGRICMDQCMIDITDTEVSVGDKVVIFGNSPSELTELAKMANTIEYESLCLVTSRVPRIVVE